MSLKVFQCLSISLNVSWCLSLCLNFNISQRSLSLDINCISNAFWACSQLLGELKTFLLFIYLSSCSWSVIGECSLQFRSSTKCYQRQQGECDCPQLVHTMSIFSRSCLSHAAEMPCRMCHVFMKYLLLSSFFKMRIMWGCFENSMKMLWGYCEDDKQMPWWEYKEMI